KMVEKIKSLGFYWRKISIAFLTARFMDEFGFLQQVGLSRATRVTSSFAHGSKELLCKECSRRLKAKKPSFVVSDHTNKIRLGAGHPDHQIFSLDSPIAVGLKGTGGTGHWTQVHLLLLAIAIGPAVGLR